ncbi:uncharacterized protein LOC103508541 [Diaphorina citri]|uniref:Uncharacterized protein LOC103508541 n=1 Tax=Diaphorina citri TaxID=121845 RepID=A0A1S4EAY0_DIACI|nr:uncharacterized protein LOC103508541 [Diaphorina citri]
MNGTNAEEDLPYQRSLKHIVSLVPKLKQELSVNGKKIKSVRFVHDEATKGEAQFQSVAVFGTIVREYENSETDNISVIIKMQICDESSLKFNNGGIQFINEVLLYND